MKALEILNTIKNCRFVQKNYGLNFDEDELIDKAIAELEDMQGRSCMNCINNSFCGVYSFLKSVKNEDDEIDTFNCPQHTRLSKE